MSDTLVRYIETLSLIPALPGKVAARDLHASLEAQGFDVDVRSVERDLHKLQERFPIISDGARPAGWSWRTRKNPIRLPRMDSATALTYELVSRYLEPALPRSMLKVLEPDFAAARSVLDSVKDTPLARWSKRIAVLPFGQQLLPPEVAPEVTEGVYEALLKNLCFKADYRAFNTEKPHRYEINPLGLAYREGVLYLVATINPYTDPRHLALHRMSKVEALDVPANTPESFNFERYIREEKSFDYPVGPDIKLELRVEAWLAKHLEESQISADQTITPIRGSEEFRVKATVANTGQLHWWLRSLGATVEVTKPASLRSKMAVEANALKKMYCQL